MLRSAIDSSSLHQFLKVLYKYIAAQMSTTSLYETPLKISIFLGYFVARFKGLPIDTVTPKLERVGSMVCRNAGKKMKPSNRDAPSFFEAYILQMGYFSIPYSTPVFDPVPVAELTPKLQSQVSNVCKNTS